MQVLRMLLEFELNTKCIGCRKRINLCVPAFCVGKFRRKSLSREDGKRTVCCQTEAHTRQSIAAEFDVFERISHCDVLNSEEACALNEIRIHTLVAHVPTLNQRFCRWVSVGRAFACPPFCILLFVKILVTLRVTICTLACPYVVSSKSSPFDSKPKLAPYMKLG